MEKETGYVYILTNPSFREDWVKIGKSSRPVDVRSKELEIQPYLCLLRFMQLSRPLNMLRLRNKYISKLIA